MKYKMWLVIILVGAAGLRLYGITKFPQGLNADEAALGYNAYSLMLTGKDEHGHPWPVNLESFADFKPALYAYLLIPFIKVMGLTDLAIRLPSALAGIVSVGMVYLFVKEIMGEEYGLASAAVLAISPWHLKFSRGGWETNLATLMMIVGGFLIVKWLKQKQSKYLVGAAIVMVLSMYTYQSARLVSPLLVVGWLIFNWQWQWLKQKQIWITAIVTFVLLVPLALSIFTTSAGSRLTGVGLLSDEGPVNRSRELRGQHQDWNSLSSRIFHNRLVLYSIAFVKNYTDHFDGNFLFVNGDMIERYKIPETGILYLSDVLWVGLGVVFLILKKDKYKNMIWWWLLVAPVASGLTFQTPNSHRSLNMVIPMVILVAVGLVSFLKLVRKTRIQNLVLVILAGLYIWQFARYLHQYYVHYPQAYPMAWDYGFNELVTYVESVQDNYNQILVTDKYDQPYILFLFYMKYPPQKFQVDHQLSPRDKFNFSTVKNFDKYHFGSTNWEEVRDTHSALIIAAPEDIPEGENVVKTINFPNNQPAFKIVSN